MARSTALAVNAANSTTATLSWEGGEGVIAVSGTWGGASVTMQFAPVDPITGVTVPPQNTDVIATSAEPLVSFYPLPAGKIRAVIEGGDGSTSLTVVAGRYK